MPMEEMLRQLGISDARYHKWRKEYGGLRVGQAQRLKELEQENSQLRKVESPNGTNGVSNYAFVAMPKGIEWSKPEKLEQRRGRQRARTAEERLCHSRRHPRLPFLGPA